MSIVSRMRATLGAIRSRRRMEQEMEEELQFHIQSEAACRLAPCAPYFFTITKSYSSPIVSDKLSTMRTRGCSS